MRTVASASARLRGWRESLPPTTPIAKGFPEDSVFTIARIVAGATVGAQRERSASSSGVESTGEAEMLAGE